MIEDNKYIPSADDEFLLKQKSIIYVDCNWIYRQHMIFIWCFKLKIVWTLFLVVS
jgi:hypothetical protein